MQYPLEITFKIWSFAPTLTVTDAQGHLVFFVKQKLFKLKEAVTVFADEQQTKVMYKINADRIIDFSARYNFTDSYGMALGAVKRKGLRSLWRARYDIFHGDAIAFTIQEQNPWVKIFDALFEEIPIIGALSGYVFHPAYLVTRANGAIVMRLEKQPSFFSRKFSVKQVDQLNKPEETQVLLSLLMMILLERSRG